MRRLYNTKRTKGVTVDFRRERGSIVSRKNLFWDLLALRDVSQEETPSVENTKTASTPSILVKVCIGFREQNRENGQMEMAIWEETFGD